MVRGTKTRGRGRGQGRVSRQVNRPVRYCYSEAEDTTQPTVRAPSPEPPAPNMEATLGAIMSRLDDMQRQINENKPASGPSHPEEDSVDMSPPRARKRPARRSPSREPSTSHQLLSIEGESDTPQSPEYTFILQTTTADFGSLVGVAVSARVRAKILANQYVDLAELLPQYSRQQGEEYLFRPDANNGTGGFVRSLCVSNVRNKCNNRPPVFVLCLWHQMDFTWILGCAGKCQHLERCRHLVPPRKAPTTSSQELLTAALSQSLATVFVMVYYYFRVSLWLDRYLAVIQLYMRSSHRTPIIAC